MTTFIIPNEEMNDIMKIFTSLEDAGLLIKDVSVAIKNEAKTKRQISQYVIRYINSSLSGNLLTGKCD